MIELENRWPDVEPQPPNRYRDAVGNRYTQGLNARQLQLVMETIHDKIAEPISVSMLASIVGFSRSHFSWAFRMAVGLSPHAHIVRLRVDRAMTLMVSSDMPLSEIAVVAGFSDQAHFSNNFRRIAGTTPKRWRRMHQR